MKTIVYSRDFEELEIRPQPTIEEYRKLIAEELHSRLIQPDSLIERPCPGCKGNQSEVAFEKYGLKYLQCTQCGSVFVSPCPSDKLITEFYRESRAARFWRESLASRTLDTRRKKIYGPLAEWIVGVIDRYCPDARRAIDVSYHSQLLVEELSTRRAFEKVFVTNPVADIECRNLQLRGVELRTTPLAQVSQFGPADVMLSIDILNCVSNTDSVFESACSSLAPGGLLLVTALSISGFDLQVLWEHSPNVYPPDRINVFSSEGLVHAVERHGFQLLEFSTPGMFDVDNVRRALTNDPKLNCTRFVRYLVMNRDADALHDFQEFLQRHRLSSFVRLALRKV
jgi:hypothetical protein